MESMRELSYEPVVGNGVKSIGTVSQVLRTCVTLTRNADAEPALRRAASPVSADLDRVPHGLSPCGTVRTESAPFSPRGSYETSHPGILNDGSVSCEWRLEPW